MTLTIDSTVGGASANSYVSEAEASAYLAARLNATAYTGESDGDKQRAALIEATRELTNMTWQGTRVTDTQALAWPRQWVTNPDAPWGWFYDVGVVPQRVKDATCELALEFLRAGTTDVASADPNQGVIRKTIDVLTTEWDGNRRPTGLQLYPRVIALIRPLLQGSPGTAEVIRG